MDWLIDEAHQQDMEVHAYFEKGIKIDKDSPIFERAIAEKQNLVILTDTAELPLQISNFIAYQLFWRIKRLKMYLFSLYRENQNKLLLKLKI